MLLLRQVPRSMSMKKYELTPEQIKKLRKTLKLTQTEFGEIIGVAKQAIIYWEKGKHRPIPGFRRAIVNLAKEKGIDLDGDE